MAKKTHFGNWLKCYLKEHHITNKELSDKIGVQERLIRQWTSGNCQPRFISGVYLIIALARLTEESEQSIYQKMAECILKDN